MRERTCCFFGHRTINETDELRTKITEAVERLITDEKVDTFLFGSKAPLPPAEAARGSPLTTPSEKAGTVVTAVVDDGTLFDLAFGKARKDTLPVPHVKLVPYS